MALADGLLPVDFPGWRCPSTPLYTHDFVEWDCDRGGVVSVCDATTRAAKFAALEDMLTGVFLPTLAEIDFCFRAEQDPKVKRRLRKIMEALSREGGPDGVAGTRRRLEGRLLMELFPDAAPDIDSWSDEKVNCLLAGLTTSVSELVDRHGSAWDTS
jgi:hypothetical protein